MDVAVSPIAMRLFGAPSTERAWYAMGAPLPMTTDRADSKAEGEAPGATSARRYPELDALMDRYARGEDAAFPQLYAALGPRIRMFLMRLCGKPRLADDLLQETFLRVHRARGSFAAGASVVPWSYAIARNAFVDHGRRGKNARTESLDEAAPGAEPEAPEGASPERQLHAQETLAVVRRVLGELPDAHREAFVLTRFEGLSNAEAAQILDTTEGNVRVRAFRAAEAFRKALRGATEEP